MLCSPDSLIMHCTMGSDLARHLRPATSLGRSEGFLGLTVTLTTRWDWKLHLLHVVRLLEGGDGAGLDQELINTDETANVTSGHVLNGLNTASHHEDGPLKKVNFEHVLDEVDGEIFMQ